MIFIIKAIFAVMLFFVLIAFALGIVWTVRIRSLFRHSLQDSFSAEEKKTTTSAPPSDSNTIEGEYKVIDEKEVK